MRFLYIHQYFNTPEMPGSTRSYEFAKNLVEKGHDVYMITSNWQKKSQKNFTKVDGIKVYWAPIRYSNNMGFYKRVISFILFIIFVLIKGSRLRYDCVIASSTPLTVGIPALIFKKIKKVNFVFEVRDMWPQLPIDMGYLKSKTIINLSKMLEKYIYQNSDKIIALSKGMKREIVKIIPDQKKISVITNLCHNKDFRINKRYGKAFREEKLKIANHPLIVYAGAFGRINNALYLIDIAEELKKSNSDIKFLLAGDGFQKEIIHERSSELKLLNKSVFLFDYFSKNELPRVLSAASVISSLFINLPSMENNSANKFFDGLAAGKPLMLNYGGWQSELISKHQAGFVIPSNNPKKASSIINNILYDKNKIELMSRNSEKLSEEFSVSSNCQRFEKIINNLNYK